MVVDRWAAIVLCGMVLCGASRDAARHTIESGRGTVDLGHGIRVDVDGHNAILIGPADAVGAMLEGVYQ